MEAHPILGLKEEDVAATVHEGKRIRDGGNQVLSALKRIGAHIGSTSKFKKASGLLRQLLEQDLITKELGDECFQVQTGNNARICASLSFLWQWNSVRKFRRFNAYLEANHSFWNVERIANLYRKDVLNVVQAIVNSMIDPSRSQDPCLRKEYHRLISTACRHCEWCGNEQKSQLEVYQIWAVLMSELHTDDSFMFNKVLKRVQVLFCSRICVRIP